MSSELIVIHGWSLESWARHICEIGRCEFPEWEWFMLATDTYQDFMRDWEGCVVKARQIKRNPELTYGAEKYGIVFEFPAWDLERLATTADERDVVLRRILMDGVENHSLLITPGAYYPVYPLNYMMIGVDEEVHDAGDN